jgi:hypothetical protein|tara:strand:- start:72 stop:404 length:333 start_codon:yes stop_codon:yes gene_type:complete
MGNRTGIRSLLNSKGKLYKRRGQPKLNPEIRVGIVARIKMYKRLSPYKAWIAVTKLKNFPWLLKLHFKNKKGNADWWVKRFTDKPESETGVRRNFWRNHLQKYFQPNKKK